jgi:cell division septum initiation protein DivIVA
MNVAEGLRMIRERLDANGAGDATLKLVDQIRLRAAAPSAAPAAAQSLLQLTRMLMRHPTTAANVDIYNDLALLEEQLEGNAQAMAARAAAEASRPVPKSHKYYKELKEKEKGKPS